MKLTILGNNSPFPGKGSACPGYLLRADGVELLLDLGTGVAGKFLEASRVELLTGIIVSHLHPDHCSDLIPLKYAVQYAEALGTRTAKLPVWMPTEPEMDYTYLTGTLKNGYDLYVLDESTHLTLGPLELRFQQTAHPFPCYAMSITEGTKRLVYTGDTGWDADLAGFAAGADLLLAECSLLADDPIRGNYTHAHLSPETAAELAREAGVKRLLLTHFWPYTPPEVLVEKAKPIFSHVEASVLGKTYEI